MHAWSEGEGPAAQFQAALQEDRFLIQRCAACERHVFHPRMLCPHCGERELAWVEASGLGTVHAVTVVGRPEAKGGPYNVVLVDLAEGVRMMSRVDGPPPEAVAIGLPVQAAVVEEEGRRLVVFRPREAG